MDKEGEAVVWGAFHGTKDLGHCGEIPRDAMVRPGGIMKLTDGPAAALSGQQKGPMDKIPPRERSLLQQLYLHGTEREGQTVIPILFALHVE